MQKFPTELCNEYLIPNYIHKYRQSGRVLTIISICFSPTSIHYQKIPLFEIKLSKVTQKFVITRKSVKILSKIITMILEAVVFGVMRVVTINCKSTLPGLISYKII